MKNNQTTPFMLLLPVLIIAAFGGWLFSSFPPDPPPSTCECPVTFLGHENIVNASSGTRVEIKLPNGLLMLLSESLAGKNMPVFQGEGIYDNGSSYQIITKVLPHTVYEKTNSQLSLLCLNWAVLCERGFPDEEVQRWYDAIYKLAGLAGEGKTPAKPPKPTGDLPARPALEFVEKKPEGLSFDFAWPYQEDASLQLLVNHKTQKGAWVRLHREDIFFPISRGHNLHTISLRKIGFQRIPKEWDFSLVLHHRGEQIVIKDFHP